MPIPSPTDTDTNDNDTDTTANDNTNDNDNENEYHSASIPCLYLSVGYTPFDSRGGGVLYIATPKFF